MKFSKKFRRVLTVTAVAAMLITTAAAAGTVTKKMIEANYRDIKVVVDGVEVELKDASGNSVEPFIYNGSTYAPFRVIGEALGKEVDWDGETNTIYIGKVPGEAENWVKKLPPYQMKDATAYDGSDRTKTFSVAGKTYDCGVTVQREGGLPFVIWNTNGEYSTLTMTIGHMGNGTTDMELEVYLDGEYSTTYEFKWDAAPKTISIPLKYAPNVKLLFGRPDMGNLHGAWGMYDISFS